MKLEVSRNKVPKVLFKQVFGNIVINRQIKSNFRDPKRKYQAYKRVLGQLLGAKSILVSEFANLMRLPVIGHPLIINSIKPKDKLAERFYFKGHRPSQQPDSFFMVVPLRMSMEQFLNFDFNGNSFEDLFSMYFMDGSNLNGRRFHIVTPNCVLLSEIPHKYLAENKLANIFYVFEYAGKEVRRNITRQSPSDTPLREKHKTKLSLLYTELL
ncbi:hypothetical protein DFA_02856 [Cavenderia fasciculata]|uniref:Uncharacterized protein n=1 Tax=Cavenderia fasciculata TaxID=261658 RepID=F4PIN3_CACFS|nr:uncharacterized protein DFA_03733 [Cavenderia fasciculata]XP_004362464.1 uncharacterized protein DFA_02856 [Cavenderia fasciculata]EGG18246.1 hypothetical protein DFA_03733 [Cavenderia fasciculata]EGG24613.1 hypothetical protein DFA_02856 [Cavenderia fasciculata]|eukprot:XP_004357069.1 hypothetical protein DFA_03733 [Cavenderia fasciculata]